MLRAIAILVIASAFPITAAAMDVEATIATRDCYAIYIGTATGSDAQLVASNCLPRPMAFPGPDAWMLPDTHGFQVPNNMQVYVVTWTRDAIDPGLLLQLDTGGMCVASGDATWRVYRTGTTRTGDDTPPDVNELTAHIRQANVRDAWIDTHCGTRNDASSDRIIGQIVPEARWMWVPNATQASDQASGEPNAHEVGECVIFRTEVLELKPERELFSVANPGSLPYALSSLHNSGPRNPLRGMTGSGGAGVLPSGGTPSRWNIVEPDLWDPPTYNNPPFEMPDPVIPGDPRVPEGGDDYIPRDTPETPEDTPEIPEPSTGLLLLCGALFSRAWTR